MNSTGSSNASDPMNQLQILRPVSGTGKTGDPVWVALSWRRITDNMVSCSVIDIDDRKRAEHTADENFNQYKQVTESSPTGSLSSVMRRLPTRTPHLRGSRAIHRKQLQGRELLSLIHEDDRPDFFQPLQRTTANRRSDQYPRLPVHHRNRVRSGSSTLFFTQIIQKDIPVLLINLVDITEQEMLEGTDSTGQRPAQGYHQHGCP
jgi:PAS domain-containing protein